MTFRFVSIFVPLLVRFTQGIFGNDPSHHIRNVIIPATPSNPSISYVKRTSFLPILTIHLRLPTQTPMKNPNSLSGRSTEAKFAKKDMAVVKVVAAVLLAACTMRNGFFGAKCKRS